MLGVFNDKLQKKIYNKVQLVCLTIMIIMRSVHPRFYYHLIAKKYYNIAIIDAAVNEMLARADVQIDN